MAATTAKSAFKFESLLKNRIPVICRYLAPLPPHEEARAKAVLYHARSSGDPFSSISNDLKSFSADLCRVVSDDNPVLAQIVAHVLTNAGKCLRPAVNLLLAKALAPAAFARGAAESAAYGAQKRLAQVTELVHTGSILHDDVVDESDLRRGAASVRKRFGNKAAVLGGDFFLAKASERLAEIGSLPAVRLISRAIADLVAGELARPADVATGAFDCAAFLEVCVVRNFLKTASLFGNSCESIAILGESSGPMTLAARTFGEAFGLSFQTVDDLLDVTAPSDGAAGKPRLSDLRTRVLTAPAVFAIDEDPALLPIMTARRHMTTAEVARAAAALGGEGPLRRARGMAEGFALRAVQAALEFEPSPFRDALVGFVRFNLERSR